MHLPKSVEKVVSKILGRDGHLEQEQRRRIFGFSASAADPTIETEGTQAELPENIKPIIEKITYHPYKVIDRDIEQLRSCGLSEDQIFEMTVSAAIGAGAGRLSLTRRLIKESQQ